MEIFQCASSIAGKGRPNWLGEVGIHETMLRLRLACTGWFVRLVSVCRDFDPMIQSDQEDSCTTLLTNTHDPCPYGQNENDNQ